MRTIIVYLYTPERTQITQIGLVESMTVKDVVVIDVYLLAGS